MIFIHPRCKLRWLMRHTCYCKTFMITIFTRLLQAKVGTYFMINFSMQDWHINLYTNIFWLNIRTLRYRLSNYLEDKSHWMGRERYFCNERKCLVNYLCSLVFFASTRVISAKHRRKCWMSLCTRSFLQMFLSSFLISQEMSGKLFSLSYTLLSGKWLHYCCWKNVLRL